MEPEVVSSHEFPWWFSNFSKIWRNLWGYWLTSSCFHCKSASYYGCMNLFTYHQLPTCLGQCMAPSNKWTDQAGSGPKSGNCVYWSTKLKNSSMRSVQPRLSCSTSLRAMRGQPFQVRGILRSRRKTQRAKILLINMIVVGGISAWWVMSAWIKLAKSLNRLCAATHSSYAPYVTNCHCIAHSKRSRTITHATTWSNKNRTSTYDNRNTHQDKPLPSAAPTWTSTKHPPCAPGHRRHARDVPGLEAWAQGRIQRIARKGRTGHSQGHHLGLENKGGRHLLTAI